MGSYVELRVDCRLTPNVPDPILSAIFFMARMESELVTLLGQNTLDKLNTEYMQVSRILNCNSLHLDGEHTYSSFSIQP
jgi:hypothetical protein